MTVEPLKPTIKEGAADFRTWINDRYPDLPTKAADQAFGSFVSGATIVFITTPGKRRLYFCTANLTKTFNFPA